MINQSDHVFITLMAVATLEHMLLAVLSRKKHIKQQLCTISQSLDSRQQNLVLVPSSTHVYVPSEHTFNTCTTL